MAEMTMFITKDGPLSCPNYLAQDLFEALTEDDIIVYDLVNVSYEKFDKLHKKYKTLNPFATIKET